MRNLFIL